MINDIDSALIQAYQAMALGFPTAYPNVEFTPPANQLWVAVENILGQSIVATLGAYGDDVYTGYLSVRINAPLDQGSKPINDVRESIRQYFRLGRSFTYNNQPVRIVYAKFPPVIPNGAYAVGVVQLFWSAFLPRSA